MGHVDFVITILLLGSTLVRALSLTPNHDEPCIVGDAWSEECKSCVCVEPGTIKCRRTFCASKLTSALDHCIQGHIKRIDCNICICEKKEYICQTKRCD